MSIPRVIIVIASSLDGRIAFPGGGESHLGSEEDKKMLNQHLSMVDATIFGLGTLIAHQSTYLIKNLYGNDEVTIVIASSLDGRIAFPEGGEYILEAKKIKIC